MFPTEAEIRYANQVPMKGGVAPSRHALARQAYLDRKQRESNLLEAPSVDLRKKMTVKNAVAVAKAWFVHIETYWFPKHRAQQ